jgi:hypothetical protein
MRLLRRESTSRLRMRRLRAAHRFQCDLPLSHLGGRACAPAQDRRDDRQRSAPFEEARTHHRSKAISVADSSSSCSARGASRKPRLLGNGAEWHRSNATENVARSSGVSAAGTDDNHTSSRRAASTASPRAPLATAVTAPAVGCSVFRSVLRDVEHGYEGCPAFPDRITACTD